jgi:formyltetrahydrofolate-dependent phosphoribosylglycinamide formyltransferase
MATRIAVLASGRGSNLIALADYLDLAGAARSGEVVLVASDRGDAAALDVARERGMQTGTLLAGTGHAASLAALLREHAIDLIVLAGYVRLVPTEVVRSYHGRIVNVHPALLPAFGGQGMYGMHVHRAVLASGARVSGATVHFVDEHYDQGPIIAQWPVPVFGDDTEHSLAARVLHVEHLLFPRAVEALAAGRVQLDADGRVRGILDTTVPEAAYALLLQPEDAILGHDITTALAR